MNQILVMRILERGGNLPDVGENSGEVMFGALW
jgi:hypothetical protein